MLNVVVQAAPFSPTAAYEALLVRCPGAAVATFTGYVRDFSDGGPVQLLELEHYPGMAERVLTDLGAAALTRFELRDWQIIHRYGPLAVNEPIVWVGAIADHRGNAFAACEFMMDTLKTNAPFWKREHGKQGAKWVAARQADAERGRRWHNDS
jgi:molybdopterin synthase catalytic subunit